MNYEKFYRKLRKHFMAAHEDVSAVNNIYIGGLPGIGKTAIVTQMAREFGFVPVTIQLGTKTLDFFMGIPTADGDRTRWTKPSIISLLEDASSEGQPLLFVDDFHLADMEVKKLMFELLTDRTIHGFSIPSNTLIILAGNPASIEFGSTDGNIPAPIRNRYEEWHLEPDLDSWLTVSKQNGIHDLILGFLTASPHFLATDPTDEAQFASPRSWWMLSRTLNLFGIDDIDLEDIQGSIGKEAGVEFLAFVKIYKDFETKLPVYFELDYKGKVALTQFLISKHDRELYSKYIDDFTADKSVRPLAVTIWTRIMADQDMADFADRLPDEFIDELADSLS